MKIIAVTFALCVVAAPAFGQLTAAEAERRLAERQAARASVRPTQTSQPAAAAAAIPATRPARKVWVAKAGAPQAVREWIAMQPYLQRAAVKDGQTTVETEKARELYEVGQAIARDRERLDKLQASGNFTHSSGAVVGSKQWVDREAERRWSEQVRELRAKIGDLIRKQKLLEAEHQRLKGAHAAELQTLKPKIMTPLVAGETIDDLKVGKIGIIGEMTVDEIVDDRTMFVRWQDCTMMLKGFPTTGMADGQHKVDTRGAMITGTQKVGRRTLFVAEPFEIAEWIELADEGVAGIPQAPQPQPRPAARAVAAGSSKTAVLKTGMTLAQANAAMGRAGEKVFENADGQSEYVWAVVSDPKEPSAEAAATAEPEASKVTGSVRVIFVDGKISIVLRR